MPLKICFIYYSIVFLALANVLAKTKSAKICVGLFYESDLQVKFKI